LTITEEERARPWASAKGHAQSPEWITQDARAVERGHRNAGRAVLIGSQAGRRPPAGRRRRRPLAAPPRQLQAIWRIARAKGLDPGAVEGMSLRAFNRKPDALTQTEASALIRELSTMRRVAA
jgi:hypothetical protein